MSRLKLFLLSGLVAVAGLAVVASSASAQASANPNASCIGVLSSFVGADPLAENLGFDKTRSTFAGAADFEGPPGQSIGQAAQFKSTLPVEPEILPGLVHNATLSCAGQAGLP